MSIKTKLIVGMDLMVVLFIVTTIAVYFSEQSRHIFILYLMSALSIVVGACATLWLMRSISKPLTVLASAAEQIASGDLTVKRIQVRRNDEIGKVTQSFNQMASGLRDLLSKVGENAEQVASSSE